MTLLEAALGTIGSALAMKLGVLCPFAASPELEEVVLAGEGFNDSCSGGAVAAEEDEEGIGITGAEDDEEDLEFDDLDCWFWIWEKDGD